LLREVSRRIIPDPDVSKRPSAQQAQEQFLTWLTDLEAHTPNTGLNAGTAQFVGHLVALAGRWGPHLFVCYSDPRIPATTNGIEGSVFGRTKHKLRKALGRGSTVGSPIHNLDFALLPLLAQDTPCDCSAKRAPPPTCSPDAYRQARKALDQQEQPAKQRRSLVRSFVKRLAALVGLSN